MWADEFKAEQVVRNYMSNAFHHVGGEKVVEVKMLSDGEKARVSVFNTGAPIPEEDVAHIWDCLLYTSVNEVPGDSVYCTGSSVEFKSICIR